MTGPEWAAVIGCGIMSVRFIQEIPTRREQKEIKRLVDEAATNARAAKEAASDLKDDVADNTKISQAGLDQGKLTNGRVLALEMWRRDIADPAIQRIPIVLEKPRKRRK